MNLLLILPVLHFPFRARKKPCLDKMTGRIDKIIVEKEDSVRIYCLCANCEREIRVMGKGEVSKIEDVYII